MSVPAFDPPEAPSVSSSLTSTNRVDTLTLHSGVTQVRPLGLRELNSLELSWSNASEETSEYLQSFLQSLKGGVGPFTWDSFMKVPSPTAFAPALSLGSGTFLYDVYSYKAVFSWIGTNSDETEGETRASMASNIVSPGTDASNKLILEIPAFPSGINKARIYVNDTTDYYKMADIEDTTTWVQDAQVNFSSNQPKTVNTLYAPNKRYIMTPGRIGLSPSSGNLWNIRMSISESYV